MEVNIVEVLSDLEDDNWRMRRSCGPENTDLFFPPTNERKVDREDREADAKTICGGCVVRQDCLEDVMSRQGEVGIWGGTNEKERKQLRRSIGTVAGR